MSLRKVSLGTTFEVYFNSTQFSTGAPFALAGTPSMGLRRYGNATQITAGLSLDPDYDAIVGYNEVSIVAATAGLVAGAIYDVYIAAGTVDSVSAVGKVVDRFQVETAAEAAIREFGEVMYPAVDLGASGSHSNQTIDMTGILAASAKADSIKGEILAISFTGETKPPELVRCTAQTVTTLLASVEAIDDGGVMSSVPAAGDKVWRVGQYTADAVKIGGTTQGAVNLATRLGTPADTDLATDILANQTDLDAIKVITDQMAFTKANELDVNTKSLNDAEVIGDGNSTPWDGV